MNQPIEQPTARAGVVTAVSARTDSFFPEYMCRVEAAQNIRAIENIWRAEAFFPTADLGFSLNGGLVAFGDEMASPCVARFNLVSRERWTVGHSDGCADELGEVIAGTRGLSRLS